MYQPASVGGTACVAPLRLYVVCVFMWLSVCMCVYVSRCVWADWTSNIRRYMKMAPNQLKLTGLPGNKNIRRILMQLGLTVCAVYGVQTVYISII